MQIIKSRSIFRFTAITLLLMIGLHGETLAYVNKKTLEEKKAQVAMGLKKVELKIADTKVKLTKEEKNLAQVDLSIHQVLTESRQLQGALNTTTSEINSLSSHIQILEKEKQERLKGLGAYLRSMQQQQDEPLLKLVFSQAKIDDIPKLTTMYGYVAKAQSHQFTQIHTKLNELLTLQMALKAKQDELSQLNARLQKKNIELAQKKMAQKVAISSYQSSLNQHVTQKKTLLSQEASLNALLKSLQKRTPSDYSNLPKNFANMTGKLRLPIWDGSNIASSKLRAANKGLYIPASEGTTVHAVFPGKVIFSEWLKGVGLLMIIDHGQGYMSLYGNNEVLYKTTGSFVEAGESIAKVGRSGGHAEPGLYFELRKNGQALNLAQWIQKS